MKTYTFLLSIMIFLFIMPGESVAVHTAPPVESSKVVEKAELMKAQQGVARKYKRAQKKLERQEKRMEHKRQRLGKLFDKLIKKASAPADTSGIGLALVIIIVGAIVAVLGLAGIADLLISIGLIVLVVGLVIWLFTALA